MTAASGAGVTGYWMRMLLMRIYVFVSGKDPDVLAFTLNETGNDLPAALGPWYLETIPGVVVIDIENDPITEAVRRDGYFITTDRISD
jgi:hypothetical protein